MYEKERLTIKKRVMAFVYECQDDDMLRDIDLAIQEIILRRSSA